MRAEDKTTTKNKDKSGIEAAVQMILGVFAMAFVAFMGFLNYRTTVIELQEQVISRIEADTVAEMENAIGFGKSFTTFYGTDEVFAKFSGQIAGPKPFIITNDGTLLYKAADAAGENPYRIQAFLQTTEFSKALPEMETNGKGVVSSGREIAIFTAIRQEENVLGYFGAILTEDIFADSLVPVRDEIIRETAIAAFFELLALLIMSLYFRNPSWRDRHKRELDRVFERIVAVVIMAVGVIILSVFCIVSYQQDYRERIESATRISLQNLENTIKQVKDQGVELREVKGLQEYIQNRVESLETLHAVRISDHIAEVKRTEESSDVISFIFDSGDGDVLYLEAEVSNTAMRQQIQSIVLTLISTLIILLMFVFELIHLVELLGPSEEEDGKSHFSEKKVSTSLRLTGFLCSTAEYMCMPYAAMMIRESGESLFGLSVGLTAALPLTLEGFTQMLGMLCLPKLVRKRDIRVPLFVATIMMIACNVTAFSVKGALAIIICRAMAGFAYSGFKQISNYLITRGYETDSGRSNNISQDNAGLLAGATCGAGLGAILSANMGYSMTFLISAGIFLVYLAITAMAVPWKALKARDAQAEETKPISFSGIQKMIFSPEMLYFILVIGIPLNIGVMLCVTLVPAICKANNISSVMLSYCYIANGIAGIYIGPALVAKAKKTFGIPLCIAFAFLLTSAGIFILHIPPVAVMIVLSSMALGFLDGFGTPMVTDQFMELKVVKNAVDESTALIFSVVLSYVLLTFAPMIAELMIQPGEGFFTPMNIGACVYAVATVLLILMKIGGKKRNA
ncbi:MAG: MFS transporter [Lachnospiraceae bacterium]|nr:MFS transporter [Lachnospiraceae bacterium]